MFDRIGSDADNEMWHSLIPILYIETTGVVAELLQIDARSFLGAMIDMAAPYTSKKHEALIVFLRAQAAN